MGWLVVGLIEGFVSQATLFGNGAAGGVIALFVTIGRVLYRSRVIPEWNSEMIRSHIPEHRVGGTPERRGTCRPQPGSCSSCRRAGLVSEPPGNTSRAPHNDWIPLPPADLPRPPSWRDQGPRGAISAASRRRCLFRSLRGEESCGSAGIASYPPSPIGSGSKREVHSSSACTGLRCQQRHHVGELMVPQTWRRPSPCGTTTRTSSHRSPLHRREKERTGGSGVPNSHVRVHRLIVAAAQPSAGTADQTTDCSMGT
jgi:hypothetical protein